MATKTATKNTKTVAAKNTSKTAKPNPVEVENNAVENVDTLPPVVDDVLEAQPEMVMNAVTESAEEVLDSNAFDEGAQVVIAAMDALDSVLASTENEGEDNYFVGTIKDLSDKYNTEPVTIYGLVRFLELTGQVKIVGTKKVEGQRGRKSNIYKIARALTINLI